MQLKFHFFTNNRKTNNKRLSIDKINHNNISSIMMCYAEKQL